MGVNGWPAIPPNYLGFRYQGKLQSIHHVNDYELVEDFAPFFPEINQKKWQPENNAESYFLYTLGPAIRPPHEIKNGGIYPNGRLWAALDLLLTSKTVEQARDRTQRRLAKMQ
jgi:hypothetical protein